MKHVLLGLVLLASIINESQAGTALYKDAALRIDEVVVVKQGAGSYYKNVLFEAQPGGRFRFVGASRSPLATVEEITIVSEATVPARVTVQLDGYKSLPCVGLEPLGMSRTGTRFHIVLAETVLPPTATCIAMTDPFTISFELDTFGLAPGAYQLNANGLETGFDLLAP